MKNWPTPALPVFLLVALFAAQGGPGARAAAPGAGDDGRAGGAAEGPGVGPTVQEVVAFTRLVPQTRLERDSLQGRVSPDGRRAFVVTRRADVARDRTVYCVLLLDVAPERLARGRPAAPRELLRVEASQDNDYGTPFVQDARWVGDRTIVLRARLADAPYQVYRLDVHSGRLRPLSFAERGVASFAVSDDLRRLVYATPVPNPPLAPGARSVVVGNRSFWSVKFGQHDLRSQQRLYQYVAAESGARAGMRRLGRVVSEVGAVLPPISMAPDGRWALVPRFRPERQAAWAGRYPLVAETAARFGPAMKDDPLGYYTRPQQWAPRQHVAYRLADGQAQAVMDAPDDALPTAPTRVDRLWLRGGQSVVIGGTHLPAGSGTGGAGDTASQLVEYWPDTGRWVVIAALQGRLGALQRRPGPGEGVVAIDGEARRSFARGGDGAWREVEPAVDSTSPGAGPDDGEPAAGGWRLRIDQGLDRPADVVAQGPGGRVVRLTTLNPGYSAARWGTMRPFDWRDSAGRPWEGGLMLPGDHDPTRRYPLVIQTYGFTPGRFYLDGTNVVDGATSAFAGRAFLRERMLVLALPARASRDAPSNEREALAAFADGVRQGIEALVAQGLVDRERVGIIGWSATGERVLNMLTFTDTPIRAASLIDGDANTLFTMTVAYGFSDGFLARMERTNQGAPFGATLADWVRNDPALHTDCIRAALRIETAGPWVLPNWDIYALLRRQSKPAEMVVIPDGTHALARPSERMLSLQGNVDWYRYWLRGEERTEPTLPNETPADLAAQYRRWHQMAAMKRHHDATPGCRARGATAPSVIGVAPGSATSGQR